jgi:hypothetical protein
MGDIIREFIEGNYDRVIVSGVTGMDCRFVHRDGLTGDGVVYFEFSKRGWLRKPIMTKCQYVIVDANTVELIDFLNKYYNLDEGDYGMVRRIIIELAMGEMEEYIRVQDLDL